MRSVVTIRISGLQKDVSDEPTVVECSGTHHFSDGQHYIRYTDPDGIKNLIKIRDGHAIVTRSGALSSIMEFKEGSRTECVYPTPYGHFETAIETHSVSTDTQADSIFLATIKYDLTLNGQKISGCELNIHLT
ncbi:MAG: DUF1934 domain-containing protein [Lachnospiraceae bacterium]|nr:DUF1934 domain-containing protein [Lachnospiraceae bacterium]